MIPTFLDLRTGKTAKGDNQSVFWWIEGNGACDCNRAITSGTTNMDFHGGRCCGHRRFIAIDVEGSLEGSSKEQLLMLMNSEYADTLEKHGI